METHILVVEDDAEIREGVAIYLKNQGYTVHGAANGAQGLEQMCIRDSRNVQRQRGAYFLFHHFSCHQAASLPQRFMRMNVTIYITFKRFKMQEKPGMRPGFYTLFIICLRGIRNPQNLSLIHI